MANDVGALQTANQELAEAVANIQCALDQLQQQNAQLTRALLRCGPGHSDSLGNEAHFVPLRPIWLANCGVGEGTSPPSPLFEEG